MTKNDTIKTLRNQLEHEKNRVAELTRTVSGLRELVLVSDALIYSIAERYGERREEKDGELIGWHLDIAKPDVENVRGEQISMHVEDGRYHIGVLATEKRIRLEAEHGTDGKRDRTAGTGGTETGDGQASETGE